MDSNDFLRRRKDRACAIILSVVDRELDRNAKERVRKVVLDQINDFYNASLDVMQSMDSGTVVVNEVWLEKIDALYEAVVNGNGAH